MPDKPLDVLAQQIVAEAAAEEEWDEDALFELFRGAYPYRNLEKQEFDEVVEMLARGYATRRGRRGALIHHDSLNHKLRARKGIALNAIVNGGAIPEVFDYRVLLEPEGHFIGTLNEDFAIESLPGDVFQLGNTSWRILRIGNGVVRVADAQGQPPSMPFWLGEAPARSDEMSAAVSQLRAGGRLRAARAGRAAQGGRARPGHRFLENEYLLSQSAAEQIATYLAEAKRSLGVVPDHRHHRARALLRRVGRHAARAARALRQPHQPRLGPRAAQEVLPGLQLRAAGGGDRGGHHPLARRRRTRSRWRRCSATCTRTRCARR